MRSSVIAEGLCKYNKQVYKTMTFALTVIGMESQIDTKGTLLKTSSFLFVIQVNNSLFSYISISNNLPTLRMTSLCVIQIRKAVSACLLRLWLCTVYWSLVRSVFDKMHFAAPPH